MDSVYVADCVVHGKEKGDSTFNLSDANNVLLNDALLQQDFEEVPPIDLFLIPKKGTALLSGKISLVKETVDVHE